MSDESFRNLCLIIPKPSIPYEKCKTWPKIKKNKIFDIQISYKENDLKKFQYSSDEKQLMKDSGIYFQDNHEYKKKKKAQYF